MFFFDNCIEKNHNKTHFEEGTSESPPPPPPPPLELEFCDTSQGYVANCEYNSDNQRSAKYKYP